MAKAKQRTYKVLRYTKYNEDNLQDVIMLTAAMVEDTYMTLGVTDYTVKDCIHQAIQLTSAKIIGGEKGYQKLEIAWNQQERLDSLDYKFQS